MHYLFIYLFISTHETAKHRDTRMIKRVISSHRDCSAVFRVVLHSCNISFHKPRTGTWRWLNLGLRRNRRSRNYCTLGPYWPASVAVCQSHCHPIDASRCRHSVLIMSRWRCGCPHRCQHHCVIFALHVKHFWRSSAPRKWRRRQQRWPLLQWTAMQQRSSRRRNEYCSCGVQQLRRLSQLLLLLL